MTTLATSVELLSLLLSARRHLYGPAWKVGLDFSEPQAEQQFLPPRIIRKGQLMTRYYFDYYDIVGIDIAEKPLDWGASRGDISIHTVKPGEASIGGHEVCGNVPIPSADSVRGPKRILQALFTRAQCPLGRYRTAHSDGARSWRETSHPTVAIQPYPIPPDGRIWRPYKSRQGGHRKFLAQRLRTLRANALRA